MQCKHKLAYISGYKNDLKIRNLLYNNKLLKITSELPMKTVLRDQRVDKVCRQIRWKLVEDKNTIRPACVYALSRFVLHYHIKALLWTLQRVLVENPERPAGRAKRQSIPLNSCAAGPLKKRNGELLLNIDIKFCGGK